MKIKKSPVRGNYTRKQIKNVVKKSAVRTKQINYKYSEDKILSELKKYIDATYDEHYSQNKFQTTEFIMDCGHGDGFCLGNAIKYIQRYGKKEGFNRKDLIKATHYCIMALHNHDTLRGSK